MTMNSRAIEPAAGSTSSRYYFVVWLALGAAGIFYVTIATLAPEALRGAEAGGIQAINSEVATLTSTVAALKTRIDASDTKQQAMATQIHSDISGLSTKFTELSGLEQAVSVRISALEGHATPDAKAAAGAASAAGSTMAISNAPPAAPQIEGTVLPGDTAAAPADTVPVAQAPAPAKPVKVATADAKPKPYAVDLAMSTSTDALRQIWQLFKDQHGALMSGLTPRSVASGSNVRLLAGPYPSQAAAASACAKMRKEGVTCQPAPLAGTPL